MLIIDRFEGDYALIKYQTHGVGDERIAAEVLSFHYPFGLTGEGSLGFP